MNEMLEKFWTYAVEVIAAILISIFVWLLAGGERLKAWEVAERSDLMVLTSGLAAGAGVIVAAYVAFLTTEFGKRLRVRGVAAEYAVAFVFPMVLLIGLAILLMFVSKGDGSPWVCAVMFSLVYSLLNFLNMVTNVIGLVRLWQDVDRMTATPSFNKEKP